MDSNTTPQSTPHPAPTSSVSPDHPPEHRVSSPLVDPPAAPESQPRKEGLRSALSTIAVLLIAPLIAVVLIAFVFQSYEVSGPSMQTTLNNSDRLIVWKLPRSWARLTGHPYVPHRGDIVVFVGRNPLDNEKQLVKRVIGLPGEKVAIKNGKLVVYNKEHPKGFQPDATLAYGKNIDTTLPETTESEWTIGPAEVFVLGDNRANSLDSRTFGPISTDDIVGKLVMRILPLNQAERF